MIIIYIAVIISVNRLNCSIREYIIILAIFNDRVPPPKLIIFNNNNSIIGH